MEKRDLRIKVLRLEKARDLPLPTRASEGSSGFDLLACIEGEVLIEPGKSKLIPTGICLEMPKGFEAQIRPRSGLALEHGVTVLNSPGTIDSDYRGEIGVILINHGSKPFKVSRGDRIAQMVFLRIEIPTLEENPRLAPSSRGEGGFGHTGMQA